MDQAANREGAGRPLDQHLARNHDDVMDVAYRRRLFECVQENQGAHLRDLARRTAIPLGTTLYHLDRLESRGFVVARRDGRYKRYFAGHSLGVVEKEMLIALRHAVPRRIVVVLLDSREATQQQLCARVGVSRSTLSFHVNRLIPRRILYREDARPENYYLLEDAALAARLLEEHRASLGDVAPLRGPVPVAPAPLLASPSAFPPAAPAGGA